MPRSNAPSGLSITYGARLIDSTPPAMKTSPSPTAIAWAAELTAWRPEPQSRLTVRPATSTGRPGEEERHPRHVAVVLARLVGAAEDDVLDDRRVDPGPVDERPDDEGREVVRADRGERAAVPPDRRADGVDDPGIAERAGQVARHAAESRPLAGRGGTRHVRDTGVAVSPIGM